MRDGSGEAEVPRRRSEKDKECEVAVWLHRPHDDRCVSREGCEDFSKETGAALTCLPVPPFLNALALIDLGVYLVENKQARY